MTTPERGDAVRTTRAVYDAMVEHALEGRPFETCGILGGTNGSITVAHRTANAARLTCVQYLIDSKDVLRVNRSLDDDDLDMLGIYHSHPFTRAYPSATDLGQVWEGLVYFIVSLTDFRAPVLGAFTVTDGKVVEHPIEIV